MFEMATDSWPKNQVTIRRSITMIEPQKGNTQYTSRPGEHSQKHFGMFHDFDIVEEDEVVDVTKNTRYAMPVGRTLMSREGGSQFMSEEVFEANENEEQVIGYDPDHQNWRNLPSDIPDLPPTRPL